MKRLKLNIQKFSSTNKTSHYNLSQYIGTDKPTYLVDYNADMSAIDTAIYNAQGKADTNATSIGTLSSLTTDAKTDLVSAINEVDSHADTNATNISNNTTDIASNTSAIGSLVNLETTAKNNLVTAINEIVEKFNFNYNNNLTVNVTTTQGTSPTVSGTMNSAYNNDGSIGKIYGAINLEGTGSGLSYNNIVVADTGLRPSSDITIAGVSLMNIERSGMQYITTDLTFTLKTNGTVELNDIPCWNNETRRILFIACLIFATDFGDVPIPPQP